MAERDDGSGQGRPGAERAGGGARGGQGERPGGGGLFQMIKFALLGFGISSPDERRENFRKWERFRRLREAEQQRYGGKSLDEEVREEHARLEREAEARKTGRERGNASQKG